MIRLFLFDITIINITFNLYQSPPPINPLNRIINYIVTTILLLSALLSKKTDENNHSTH